jgi:hypothetical protein
MQHGTYEDGWVGLARSDKRIVIRAEQGQLILSPPLDWDTCHNVITVPHRTPVHRYIVSRLAAALYSSSTNSLFIRKYIGSNATPPIATS